MPTAFDILGLGCTTVDDFLYVDAFPAADAKTRIESRDRQCGGLTGTALVAAARFGARCAYGGALGDDELSAAVIENFRREGIDVSTVVRRPDARPIHSTIVVARRERTRNIFFHVGGPTGADPEQPGEAVIRAAKVLFVDHYNAPGNLRAIGIARAAGVEVVADFERDNLPGFAEMVGLPEHLLVSRKFALHLTGSRRPEDAVAALWSAGRRAVVVTAGEEGCYYRSAAGGPTVHHRAFAVDPIDTTGCGDVFHGVYAATLAQGEPIENRIRLATAAAALKASHPGGQRGAPTAAAVRAFLDRNG